MDTINVLAIVGSLRQESFNLKLAKAASKLAPDDLEIEIYVPSELPLFSQDLEKDLPTEVKEYKEKIEVADAILFVSPEQNHTLSAVIKNAIEWGNRPWGKNSFFNKPGGVIGASSSNFATVRMQNHMRQVFVDLSIISFLWPQVMVGNAKEKFDDDGNLTDQETRERLQAYLDHFAQFVRTVPQDPMIFTTEN